VTDLQQQVAGRSRSRSIGATPPDGFLTTERARHGLPGNPCRAPEPRVDGCDPYPSTISPSITRRITGKSPALSHGVPSYTSRPVCYPLAGVSRGDRIKVRLYGARRGSIQGPPRPPSHQDQSKAIVTMPSLSG